VFSSLYLLVFLATLHLHEDRHVGDLLEQKRKKNKKTTQTNIYIRRQQKMPNKMTHCICILVYKVRDAAHSNKNNNKQKQKQKTCFIKSAKSAHLVNIFLLFFSYFL